MRENWKDSVQSSRYHFKTTELRQRQQGENQRASKYWTWERNHQTQRGLWIKTWTKREWDQRVLKRNIGFEMRPVKMIISIRQWWSKQ